MCSLEVYTRFVSALSHEEQERYHREMSLVARIFGVPAEVLPSSLRELRTWFAGTLEGGSIVVTAPAREVAAVLLAAPLPAPLRLLAPAHRLSTAGLLPQRLRLEYGLRWSRAHELALPVAARSLKYAAAPLFIAAERIAAPSFRLAA
jgi:uncharacterized protein (DUF2236 family)